MEQIQSLVDLLNFDPVLLAVFTGLAMLYIQALKPIWSVARDYPQLLNIILTLGFAVLIVFEVVWALQILILTYLMMIGASGLYSSAKTEKEENPAGL